jgi:hypothetical protein
MANQPVYLNQFNELKNVHSHNLIHSAAVFGKKKKRKNE